MPLASSTVACDETSAGTAGLDWIPVRNDAVSTAIKNEPASAVPIEAPRLVAVFCRPPTSRSVTQVPTAALPVMAGSAVLVGAACVPAEPEGASSVAAITTPKRSPKTA